MYDPMIYTDMLTEEQFCKKQQQLKRKQLFAVRCKSGFFQTYKFISSQQNSHAVTNVIYDFFKLWAGFKIQKITPTDAYIIEN